MTRTLIGVGVGPGDPEQLTLKALRELRGADVVFAPCTDPDRLSRAEEVVLAAARLTARRLVFALDDRGGVTEQREAAWDAAARTVVGAFDQGAARIAFVTLGDPNVYSTFGYLAQSVALLDPGVRIETVAGITAMQDLASRAVVRLAEGREPLTLVPATAGLAEVAAALAGGGTVVVYKGGRSMRELVELADAHGRSADAVLGSELGLPGERIVPLREWDEARASYFTTLIIPAARGGRGAAL
ncbi:precorrin-2 C(20)-methyltransferase [Actinospica durhamensis]|uniref:Precorrin-2 C(20)-methyltransferase n=1 Tax=Actinospica durhamensis TaxID=1508375 RepID=A0A941ETW9_9ACTN|nr:precorrin-2 C(20)-methyltransferase [Actinospica durhamensis]MBR7838022.1 precorrin-2 C(20)-methyltransferase [Actinospica durhamensis]